MRTCPIHLRGRRGFSLLEVVVVLVLFGAVLSITLGRLRISEEREVEMASSEVVRLLDMARAKAIATRRGVRVRFDGVNARVTAYLDHDRDGTITESQTEQDAFQGFGTQKLRRGVRFGRGSASAFPGDSLSGAITLPGEALEFDSRGIPTPLGTSGVLYIRHNAEESVVAAISVTGSASFRLWRWLDGAWR